MKYLRAAHRQPWTPVKEQKAVSCRGRVDAREGKQTAAFDAKRAAGDDFGPFKTPVKEQKAVATVAEELRRRIGTSRAGPAPYEQAK